MSTFRIKAYENGPYVIAANARYRDSNGESQNSGGAAVALCRCGHTAKSPFCDGAHKAVGFKAAAIELDLEPVS